jgi:organic hydroperoxide reductase OsmC/OhrA
MSLFCAEISWQRGEAQFLDNRYSRGHHWSFDGGATIPASSSPQVATVTLNPRSIYSGTPPDLAKEAELHHRAHALCFIANSVKTKIEIKLVD